MRTKTIRLLGKAVRQQGRLVEATRLLQKALIGPALAIPPVETAKALAARLGWPMPAPPAAPTKRPAGPATGRPAARAAVPHPGSSFEASTHSVDGVTRQYKLYVPSSPATTPALVVMLHGCTQDADDFAAGTRMNTFAERDGFLVLYPQQSRDANAHGCWNWFNRRDQQRDTGEAGFIADLIREVAAAHRVDPARIYVAGLSAGGAMAAIVASEYPDLIAAAGIHSGLPAGAAGNLPDALTAMRNGGGRKILSTYASGVASPGLPPVPTIVFHGDADRTVHASNGEQLVSAVLDRVAGATTVRPPSAAATTDRHTRTDHVDGAGDTLVEHWLLHGAGHAWSGGDPAGSYVDPQGIDASAEMVRFFRAHPQKR